MSVDHPGRFVSIDQPTPAAENSTAEVGESGEVQHQDNLDDEKWKVEQRNMELKAVERGEGEVSREA
jgi:hypothetical protein